MPILPLPGPIDSPDRRKPDRGDLGTVPDHERRPGPFDPQGETQRALILSRLAELGLGGFADQLISLLMSVAGSAGGVFPEPVEIGGGRRRTGAFLPPRSDIALSSPQFDISREVARIVGENNDQALAGLANLATSGLLGAPDSARTFRLGLFTSNPNFVRVDPDGARGTGIGGATGEKEPGPVAGGGGSTPGPVTFFGRPPALASQLAGAFRRGF